MELFGSALGFGSIGLAAGFIGAVIAAFAARGARASFTSYIQHFAAGLILAAASLDLLPEAMHLGGGWPLLIGFAVGFAFMLAVRAILMRLGQHDHGAGHEHGASLEHGSNHEHSASHHEHGSGHTSGINLTLIIALLIVILIDGAVIGISLSAGGGAALLIAIALAIELMFVSASTASSVRASGTSVATAIGVGTAIALMMPVGAVLGALVFAGIATPLLIAGIAFGAAALIFTAVAELLVEAYEVKESTGTIAMLGAGFLVFLGLMAVM